MALRLQRGAAGWRPARPRGSLVEDPVASRTYESTYVLNWADSLPDQGEDVKRTYGPEYVYVHTTGDQVAAASRTSIFPPSTVVRTDDVLAGYGTHGTAAYAARAPLTRSRLQHGGTTKEASRHKQSSKQAASNQEVKQVKRPTFFQLPTSTPPSNQRGWLLAVRFSSSPPPFRLSFSPPRCHTASYLLFRLGATSSLTSCLGGGPPPVGSTSRIWFVRFLKILRLFPPSRSLAGMGWREEQEGGTRCQRAPLGSFGR